MPLSNVLTSQDRTETPQATRPYCCPAPPVCGLFEGVVRYILDVCDNLSRQKAAQSFELPEVSKVTLKRVFSGEISRGVVLNRRRDIHDVIYLIHLDAASRDEIGGI